MRRQPTVENIGFSTDRPLWKKAMEGFSTDS